MAASAYSIHTKREERDFEILPILRFCMLHGVTCRDADYPSVLEKEMKEAAWICLMLACFCIGVMIGMAIGEGLWP